MALLNSKRFPLSPAWRACTICKLYGRMTKSRLSKRHAVGWGILHSWLERRMDFLGLREKSLELLRLHSLNSSLAVGSPFTKAACFFKLFVPTTNVFGTWRSNTKTPLKHPLHWNNRIYFAELQNTERFLLRAITMCGIENIKKVKQPCWKMRVCVITT